MLIIKDIIREFSSREILPVQVKDVFSIMVAAGIQDEFYFWDTDKLNADVMKGLITDWHYPINGTNRRVTDIYTARSMTEAEKRLVQTKELLHVIDPNYFRVNTLPATLSLIDKIVISPALQDPETDGDHANSDRAALWHALAVLFPLTARNLFVSALRAGKVTLPQIADHADLPLSYVALAMSEHWPRLHKFMSGI